MSTNNTRKNKRKMQEMLKEDDVFEIENFTCWIYLYRFNGKVIYVGQTIDIVQRMKQHKSLKRTKFDKFYNKERAKDMVCEIIEERTFSGENGETFKDAAAWMNEREIHYIAEHDTYNDTSKFNFTTGGQPVNKLVALMEYNYKTRIIKFKDVYMPAFKSWYKENGHPIIPYRHPVLGVLLDNIRHNEQQVPARYKKWFETRGFFMSHEEWKWANLYLPAFHAHYQEHNNCDVSRCDGPVSVVLSPVGWDERATENQEKPKWDGINLGQLVTSLRAKNGEKYERIPKFAKEWFDAHGGFPFKATRGPGGIKIK